MSKYLADRNPVMAGSRPQIAGKRLALFWGSEIPSGKKVSFEDIVCRIISDYSLILRAAIPCVQKSRNLLQLVLLGSVNVMLAYEMWSNILVIV